MARKSADGWHEEAVPVSSLSAALAEYGGEENVYISQGRFKGWRRTANLIETSSLHADLDYYNKPDLASKDPRGVAEDILTHLEREGIPAPSVFISSGKGLYPLWLHSPIPRRAVPRWKACEAEIARSLESFCVDAPATKDVARVLRLPGSIHTASGNYVRVLEGYGTGEVWVFDDLADEILPLARAELADLRVQRARQQARKPREAKLDGRPAHRRDPGTLWETRLADLQRLREIRGSMEGYRDRFIFVAGVAVSWLAVPEVMERELYGLASDVGWSEAFTRSKMGSLLDRTRKAYNGEKSEFSGKEVDPRYQFKTNTIIEWLGITRSEQREMRDLCGPDAKREREAERGRRRRKEDGAVSRADYLDLASLNRSEAHRMRSEGMSIPQIIDALGVSKRTVQNYLADGDG